MDVAGILKQSGICEFAVAVIMEEKIGTGICHIDRNIGRFLVINCIFVREQYMRE